MSDERIQPAARRTSRTGAMFLATVATIALLWLVSIIHVPYVIEAPGPTLDTLGEQGGKPLITVQDAKTYPTNGKLLATTVSIWGGPGSDLSLLELLAKWSEGGTVIPEHLVFGTQETAEERDQTSEVEQTSSQEAATVAALEEMGTKVPATLTIAEVPAESPSDGKLRADDVLRSINGTKLTTYPDLVGAMAKVKPGEKVTVGFDRAGTRHTAQVVAAENQDGSAILGLLLNPSYDIPIDVEFNIEDVGGPSAGTMYALGIIDKLTPSSLTAGKIIAGTGTIDAAGRVGPIGGAEQKIRGAERDGAQYFLVPRDNCRDLRGHVPSGIEAVPITTLHEAHTFVADIAQGKSSDLPTCPAQ